MAAAPDPIDRAFGPDRRRFVKGLIGAAFAAPVVSSFTMSGIDAVFGGISGATTLMSNSNTAGPNFPSNRGCVTVQATGGTRTFNFNGGDGTSAQLFVPNGCFPDARTLCVFRGDLAALKNSVPPDYVVRSAYAVVFQFGDAQLPITLTVTDGNVNVGDAIFRVDQGTQTYPGTVGTDTWNVAFTDDPSFVVATPPATPAPSPSPTPAPGIPSAPGGGDAGTGSAAPASPTTSNPRFTG